MAFLEAWLESHGGVPPLLNLHTGGYVCLDATPMERLSGALTCVNQAMFGKKVGGALRQGNRVPAAHQADLDRICARFGLRWRKVYRDDGVVDPRFPTFAQEAYRRFREYVKAHGPKAEWIQRWYPGFPEKHSRMEAPETSRAALPARRAVRRCANPRPVPPPKN